MQTIELVSAPAKCWSCGQQVAGGQPFCGSCGKVQPPRHAGYFEMFGLPHKLDLDVPALEKQFYRYSRKLHPDVHARASAQEQEWSLAQASLLNDAYRTLKHPLERTKYLLQEQGVQFENARNPSKVPADLLEEVFELNMQLEELRQTQKMGEDDPQLRRDLESAKQQFAAQLATLDQQVRAQWTVWDAALEQEDEAQQDEAQKTAAKEAMTALLQRRSYLENLVRDVEQTLGAS